MSIKCTAIIKRKSSPNPRTGNNELRPSVTLLDESGKVYGPLLFQSFEQMAARLSSEAGVTHEKLQDCYARYDRGEELRILLNLENDAAIETLGFSPNASHAAK